MIRTHRVAAVLGMAGLAGAMTAPAVFANGTPATAVERFSVRLGDFTSTVRLDHPRSGRAPLIILVHGAGPTDLDANVAGEDGEIRSHIFRDISRHLTTRGFAVLRYNKRYVTGPAQTTDRFGTLTMRQMRDDVETVMRTAREDARVAPHVVPDRMFLYGWSEGSSVVADVASRHPGLAGVIFQGGVNVTWRAGLLDQVGRVAVPYLRRFTRDGDTVTPSTLRRAWRAEGGMQAKEWTAMLATDIGRPDPVVSPAFDTDRDGRIAIGRELLPNAPAFVDALLAPTGVLSRWGTGRGLPSVAARAPRLRMPVLSLQGRQDGNVPPDSVRLLHERLARSGHRDHTLLVYPGLGHSLGPARAPSDDRILPIGARPLRDLTGWLRHRS
ncbi:alpha/beta hydrolase family protein [Spirillospora sp. CA-294931]|uniref:alpha/beta hydrolase family protein n=1 Tax=Spirillospora sp. CA-294931 TaxID=3240042 RepID=UPI003D8CA814